LGQEKHDGMEEENTFSDKSEWIKNSLRGVDNDDDQERVFFGGRLFHALFLIQIYLILISADQT